MQDGPVLATGPFCNRVMVSGVGGISVLGVVFKLRHVRLSAMNTVLSFLKFAE